jgi:uncharacterized protein
VLHSFAQLEAVADAAYAGQPDPYGLSHVRRVCQVATRIRDSAGGDLAVIQAAALFHHLAGPGEGGDQADAAAEKAGALLVENNLDDDFADEVAACIRSAVFSRRELAQSPEAQVLWDANQLDFLGMVGLARLFALAGAEGAPLFGALSRAPNEAGFFGDPPASVEALFGHRLKGLSEELFFPASRTLAKRRLELSEAFFARAHAERHLHR